jgi:probable HAF family extracellular repeat protein
MSRLGIAFLALATGVYGQTQPMYTIQALGSLAGMPICLATAISQAGIVAGYCYSSSTGTSHGFIYSNGKTTDMGAASQPAVFPLAVND